MKKQQLNNGWNCKQPHFVTPVHLQPVFGLPVGLQLVPGVAESPGHGVPHVGDQLQLLKNQGLLEP